MSGVYLFAALISVLAAVLTVGFGWLVMKHGPKDHPDGERKTQSTAMPTSGGIAIFLAAIPVTLVSMFLFDGWLSLQIIVLLLASAGMFLMGLWDDLVNLPALPKLLVQVVLALFVTWFGVRVSQFDLGRNVLETGFLIAVLGSATWFVVVTNAVNFMDGSDGLAMGASATIAGGIALLAGLSGAYDLMAFALIMFGALIGHLVWNGRGKLFTGDSGALFVGFYLAGLTLILIERTGLSVWVGPLLFIGFLADVLLTLIWRYQHKRSLMKPHLEHVYQIMIRTGASHALVAWIYIWVTLHGVFVSGMSLLLPRGGAMAGFAALILILYILNRRIRGSAIRHGLISP